MNDNLIHAFDVFIKEQSKRVDKLENDDSIVYNIYKQINTNFDLISIPNKFNSLKYIIHIPYVILTENGLYYPGTNNYDENIECFSIMVSK